MLKVKESSARKIESALIEDIAAGVLVPGERVDETRLASRFGVSRTPVREALNRLLALGILEPGEGRGLAVATYTREQLGQIFEAMFEIEAVCARLASQRLSLLSRSRIEAAQNRCAAAAEQGDRLQYLRANEAFHQEIYDAMGNPFLAELAADFRRRTGPFRAKKFVSDEDLKSSVESHQLLLKSIFSNNSSVADAGMREHMTSSIMQYLSSH